MQISELLRSVTSEHCGIKFSCLFYYYFLEQIVSDSETDYFFSEDFENLSIVLEDIQSQVISLRAKKMKHLRCMHRI